MKHALRGGTRLALATLAALILTAGLVPAAFAQKVGEAETIVGSVFGESVNKTLRPGASLKFRQKVRVGDRSAAGIRFIDDTSLSIGAKTSIVIDEFVYDPNRGVVRGSISLARGFMRFASKRGIGKRIKIHTPIGSIGVRGTTFDTMAKPNGLEVAVHDGVVQVDGRGASRVVLAGEVLRLDGAGGARASRTPSPEMTANASALRASFGKAGRRMKRQALYAGAKSGGGADDPINRSSDDILALDLRQGRVLIQLLEDLAPNHVARIKALAADGFYDGLQFFDVKADFAAITGDPTSSGGGGSGQPIDAEFSKAPFKVGSVGMIRGRGDPNSADSQFFIAFKELPHLVGEYTKWGQVIYGMEHITALAQGRSPRRPDTVGSLRLLSEAP